MRNTRRVYIQCNRDNEVDALALIHPTKRLITGSCSFVGLR
jgi:hypothetical protein